jgi:hypothetical protein
MLVPANTCVHVCCSTIILLMKLVHASCRKHKFCQLGTTLNIEWRDFAQTNWYLLWICSISINCHKNNTWWHSTPYIINHLDVSTLREKSPNHSSRVSNSRILVGVCRAAEGAQIEVYWHDRIFGLFLYFSYQTAYKSYIFIGSEVVQFLHRLCPILMYSIMGLSDSTMCRKCRQEE